MLHILVEMATMFSHNPGPFIGFIGVSAVIGAIVAPSAYGAGKQGLHEAAPMFAIAGMPTLAISGLATAMLILRMSHEPGRLWTAIDSQRAHALLNTHLAQVGALLIGAAFCWLYIIMMAWGSGKRPKAAAPRRHRAKLGGIVGGIVVFVFLGALGAATWPVARGALGAEILGFAPIPLMVVIAGFAADRFARSQADSDHAPTAAWGGLILVQAIGCSGAILALLGPLLVAMEANSGVPLRSFVVAPRRLDMQVVGATTIVAMIVAVWAISRVHKKRWRAFASMMSELWGASFGKWAVMAWLLTAIVVPLNFVLLARFADVIIKELPVPAAEIDRDALPYSIREGGEIGGGRAIEGSCVVVWTGKRWRGHALMPPAPAGTYDRYDGLVDRYGIEPKASASCPSTPGDVQLPFGFHEAPVIFAPGDMSAFELVSTHWLQPDGEIRLAAKVAGWPSLGATTMHWVPPAGSPYPGAKKSFPERWSFHTTWAHLTKVGSKYRIEGRKKTATVPLEEIEDTLFDTTHHGDEFLIEIDGTWTVTELYQVCINLKRSFSSGNPERCTITAVPGTLLKRDSYSP